MQINLVMKPADPEKTNCKQNVCNNENPGCGNLENWLFTADVDSTGNSNKKGKNGESYEKKLSNITEYFYG